MSDLRGLIQGQIHQLVGFGSGEIDLTRPPGDPGLFGPDSAAWVVHGDFTTMMAGGVASLLLQMLHPGALAGVWDHSHFQRDMGGRLRRTAQFISVTTYGSTAAAEASIDRVRRIHDRITGATADGASYAANDPALLAWVHNAEVASFLSAHLRYRDPAFSAADQDRYIAEMAVLGRLMGTGEVPTTRAALDRYLEAMRPALRADHRTRAVARAILDQPAPTAALRPFQHLVNEAARTLLPPWAARLHGLDRSAHPAEAVRAGMAGVGSVLRWALTDGSAARARAQA